MTIPLHVTHHQPSIQITGMFQPPATVGPSVVFNDQDGNGQRDPTFEPPLPDVTIDLFCYRDGEAVLIGTTVTNADGEYIFSDVLPGQCYIEVTPPNATDGQVPYEFSPVVPGGNQIDTDGTSPVVDIEWNQIVDDWEVAMYVPVSLGNKVIRCLEQSCRGVIDCACFGHCLRTPSSLSML